MTYRKEDGYNSLLATRIREIMDKRNIKQKELSEKTGISRQRIGYYSDGKNVPDAETLAKIAQALDVSADYLLGLSEPDKEKEVIPFKTCADAIRLISMLSDIKGTDINVNYIDNAEYEQEYVSICLYAPGLIKYYQGLDSIRKTLSKLPNTLFDAAFRFQVDARKKLMDEAQKTELPLDELPF